VEPNNKAVLNELRNTDILLRKEKELYQKMFPGQKVPTGWMYCIYSGTDGNVAVCHWRCWSHSVLW